MSRSEGAEVTRRLPLVLSALASSCPLLGFVWARVVPKRRARHGQVTRTLEAAPNVDDVRLHPTSGTTAPVRWSGPSVSAPPRTSASSARTAEDLPTQPRFGVKIAALRVETLTAG
jgi:hypothetical protein